MVARPRSRPFGARHQSNASPTRPEADAEAGSESSLRKSRLRAPGDPSDLDAVEEDTEAFLEKVFSQLESNGQPEEEGHGLLRRRRLGSVLKELNEEN